MADFVVPTRNQIRDTYLRDYKIYNTSAVTDDGTEPFARASALADTLAPIYGFAVQTSSNLDLATADAATVKKALNAQGTDFLPADGAGGFVTVSIATGGSVIVAGDEIRYGTLRYQCTLTRRYYDQDAVPVKAIDVGPQTNVDAGSVMLWTSPRQGVAKTATVLAQADGSGLSGGRNAETVTEAVKRLIDLRKDPPAGGNDAQYRWLVEHTPGLAVQKAFTVPAVFGPGTTSVMFTMQPSSPGASRIPSSEQLQQVQQWVTGQMPADDSAFFCSLIEQSVDVKLIVKWSSAAVGWSDLSPWPTSALASSVVSVTDALNFVLSGNPSGPFPVVGTTIAFWDIANGVFRQKKVLTVSIDGPTGNATIKCDTTNGASDTTYTPYVAQTCGPWSDTLQSLVSTILSQFDAFGPGEQIAGPFDGGLRQKRTPDPNVGYPYSFKNNFIFPLFSLSAVDDVQLVSPSVGFTVTVGSAGVDSTIFQLGNLTIYAA